MLARKKRGLSDVVANLLIILLVLISIGIVWVVIRSVIEQGASDVEIGQFTFDVSIESANSNGTHVVVAVRRGVGGGSGLVGMNFIFTNEEQSLVVKRSGFVEETGRRTFIFSASEIPGMGQGDEVSVAPIYQSAGEEKTGNPTDSAEIGGEVEEGESPGPTCGNAQCEIAFGETATNCPADCTGIGGAICGNAQCETGEDSFSCPADCSIPLTCDGTWNQDDVTEGSECDGSGHCLPNCICESGFGPSGSGTCVLDPALNTGIIFSVWHGLYFDSESLPKGPEVNDYINDYVNFTGSSETGCFLITFGDYLADDDISYLRVDDSLGIPNLAAGEGYSVWEAENCGL